MTKQEEIEEGLVKVILNGMKFGHGVAEITLDSLSYLHSVGCAIKAERELPTYHTSKMPTCERGLECTFVEPLTRGQ